MIYRTISQALQKSLETFPALVLTGPRQSGKTTLLKAIFGSTHQYLSLETTLARQRAREDPLGLINQYHQPLIIDEIQYAPELLSYLKEKIDQDRVPNQYLLTGSQNFTLMTGISQSLAGRAAIFSLLPLSLSENFRRGQEAATVAALLRNQGPSQKIINETSIEEIILRGSYPEVVANPQVSRETWCGSYITTYLERDVRNIERIGDLHDFERFLRLCAVRTGQILNLSELARDVGISVTTAKRWLSVLEASYQIYLLYPYYQNIGKRLIKSPKVYFVDTGLASYLLGLNSTETLRHHPNFSNLFETLVVTDFYKRFLNTGQAPALYYLRTQDGLEVDLVIELEQRIYLLEIKASSTIHPKHALALKRAGRAFEDRLEKMMIISLAGSFELSREISNFSWHQYLTY